MNQFDPLTDEELILLMRAGDNNAYSLLICRFLGPSRKGDICRAFPGILTKYSLWEVSSVSFNTFWSCLDRYRFGAVRFHTYYIDALRFNLIRFDQRCQRDNLRIVSIDGSLSDTGNFTLHDVLSTNEGFDDPKNFINYYETLKEINKLPKAFPKETLEIAKMKANGMTFYEISEALGLTYRQVYVRYQKFLEKAKKLVTKDR